MSAPVLNSISPASGAPGSAIALSGSGFDAAAQVCCPVVVNTTFTDSANLAAAIPADIEGPEGGAMAIGVFVRNPDGSSSNVLQFTVSFPLLDLQTFASIDRVCGEVPGFIRGSGLISDDNIRAWMRSIARTALGTLLRRGLPLDPTQWQQASAQNNYLSAEGVLEQVVRLGAAARLAAAASAQFSVGPGESGLSKNLSAAYKDELARLDEGEYDKLFLQSAATVESGQLVAAGSLLTLNGGDGTKFRKEKVF